MNANRQSRSTSQQYSKTTWLIFRIDGVGFECAFSDNAGQEDPDTHIYCIFFFSIDAPDSLHNVEKKVGRLHIDSEDARLGYKSITSGRLR
jgi:hypothetical protein